MILSILQLAVVAGLAAYLYRWRASAHRRNTQSWGSLMARLRSDWNSRELDHPALWAGKPNTTPEEMWERIDGARGLCAMFQNAGVMLEMADYAVRNSNTVDHELVARLRADAMQIRVSVLEALARYAFCQVNEGISVNALRAASMYTEMTSKMARLLQANAAGMVPQFVAAM